MRFITTHTQPRQSNESWSLCGKTLSALHLSINKLWFKGPHSFPEMKVLSAENFVVPLFVVQPRTVIVQDDFEALFKEFLEGKSLTPKWRKSADKSLWQPSCNLRSPAAKDNSITNAATARSPGMPWAGLEFCPEEKRKGQEKEEKEEIQEGFGTLIYFDTNSYYSSFQLLAVWIAGWSCFMLFHSFGRYPPPVVSSSGFLWLMPKL